MSQYVLTPRATVTCPHGGTASTTPSATRVLVDGEAPLRMSDASTIAGCSFTVGTAPSPCLRIQWTMPPVQVSFEGSEPLTHTTVGLCVNAAGAPQGTVTISGFQTRVTVR